MFGINWMWLLIGLALGYLALPKVLKMTSKKVV